jgi:hypothetical protein
MSVEHMIPTLPDAAPMDGFVQSNRIPSLASRAYEATGTYAVEMGLTGSEITLSPGDVLYRQPPTTTDADRDMDSPYDEWGSGETWWFIVGVEPDRFLIFDLERGIYRSWPDDRVVADLRAGYTYDVFTDNR